MPDVAMCGNRKCPLRKECYRSPASGTKPNEWRQSWMVFNFSRKDGKTTCQNFWPMDDQS